MNSTSLSSAFRRLGGLIFTLVALLWPQVTAANLPPQLLILNAANELTAREDTPIALRLVVTDAETPARDLQVTATSVDGRLLPAGSMVVEGDGNERVVRVTPAANASGVSGVIISVADGSGGLAQGQAYLTWTPVDDLPVLALIPHQITTEGAPPLWVPFSFTAPEPPDLVRFTAGSSRSNLATLPTITTTGTNRWLNLRLANGFVGSSVITIYPQAAKEVAAAASVSFALTVLPREFALTNGAGTTGDRAVVFDGDGNGWPEVVSGSLNGFDIISQNRSGRLFPGVQLPIAASSVAVGDADGDGDLDAYLAQSRGPGVFWQNASRVGGLMFSRQNSFFAPGTASDNAAWADFDGDGDLDLIAGGGSALQSRPVLFARNDGAGGFVTLTNRLPAARAALLVADFDGDGAADVLLGSGLGQTNQAVVWRNEGGFRFMPTSWQVPAPLLLAAGAVDFDGDGRLDLWVLHRSSNSNLGSPRVLALWRQTSVGFAEVLRLPGEAVAQAGPPAWGDFDGDGWPDFVAPRLSPAVWGTSLGARVTNCFALYRNDGRGGFTAGNYLFGNTEDYSPAVADFDRDGSLDLWMPGSQRQLMFNQLRRPNLPPGAPTGLFALAAGTNVLFTWLPAHDLNQTAPLTYNLRVGTRPGSNDVVASMSLDDGTRLLPAPGNAGFALSRRVLLGPVDTDVLYWSVQAVDNSFAGGMWAPEQTVRVEGIPNEPPVIHGMADVMMNEDTTVVINVTITDDSSSPAQVVTEVSTSNRTLFPTLRLGPGRATHDEPSTNRSIALRPASNAFGEAEIRMIATDGRGASTTNRVKVTVRPVNDAPIVSELVRQFVFTGQPIQPIYFTVHDEESAPESLQVTATSLTPDLIATGRIGVSGTGVRRVLTAMPEAGRTGPAEIELAVSDGSGENGVTVSRLIVEIREQAFTPLAGALAEEAASTLCWGDFDGDGRPDLLTVNRDTRALRLWRNEGAGRFSGSAADLSAAGEVTLVAAGDLDGDGDLDIVTIGHDGKAVWLRNHGDRFVGLSLPAGFLGAESEVLKVADADGDGSKDVVLVSTATSAIMLKVWRNLPSGFSLRESSFGSLALASPGLSTVVFADQDSDGRMDLEIAYAASSPAPAVNSMRLLGTADGSFVPAFRPWHLGHRELLAWDDFTGDGLGDALVVQLERPWVTVFAGTPEGSYVAGAMFGLPLGNAVTGDLNGDGRTDLVTFGGGEIAPLLNSVASGWRTLPVTAGSGSIEGIPAPLADMDGDGDLDLAAHLFARDSVRVAGVIRNDQLVTNRPPGAVISASHLVNADGSVALRWQPAADAEQTNALTYNLRMGTAPGSNDVWSAEALPDGRKLVPGPGNLGWRTNLMLSDLKPGRTYYWSVQAVDASFAGGPFAPEQSFLLVGEPKRVNTVVKRGPGKTLEFSVSGQPHVSVRVESSTDLRVWQTVQFLSLDAAGELNFGLSPEVSDGGLFYRLIEIP